MPNKEMTRDSFRKKYPNLSREMDESEAVEIEGEEEEEPEEEGAAEGEKKDRVAMDSHGYDPTVFDFLARCNTDKQALEIIDYLERRGELTKEQALSLRQTLHQKGVRSFGEKRGAGHYDKKFSK
jgi:hypothetical protein